MGQALFDWLTALPQGALLGAMALLAMVENIFPPIPADVLVAFGGFLAARAEASPWPAFFAVWIGNVGGAALMYALGRRFGSTWVERKFKLKGAGSGNEKFRELHQRYGTPAIFISRFLPGVRSIVPPLAGALKLAPVRTLAAVALASGLWYGFITWLAFSAGNNWEELSNRIGLIGRWTGAVATGIALVVVGIWWWRRRQRRRA
jgi:membrane protein DedA with SNARE-associated domain